MTVKDFFTHYYSLISSGELESLDFFFQDGSPYFNSIKRHYESLHRQYNIITNIEHVELIAKQDDLLIVRDKINFELSNTESSKKTYQSNLHLLIKSDDNHWKIYSSLNLFATKD